MIEPLGMISSSTRIDARKSQKKRLCWKGCGQRNSNTREGSVLTPVQLKNLARGGRGFHANRFSIFRAALAGVIYETKLSKFLRNNLFKLPEGGWTAYAFTTKDWEVAEFLISDPRSSTETSLLSLVLDYIEANTDSVAKLYAMADVITGRLLSASDVDIAPQADVFHGSQSQSLFAFRVACGTHQASPQAMRTELEKAFPRNGWCHTRLMYPLINLVVHGRSADELDDFLAYFATGSEHPAEVLTQKLLLSDTAAREAPLQFKLFVGLMGHPFDACEFLLDHIEFAIVSGCPLPEHLERALHLLATFLPATRVLRLAGSAPLLRTFTPTGPEDQKVHIALRPYGLGLEEAKLLSQIVSIHPVQRGYVDDTPTSIIILANMRQSEYPDPGQFLMLITNKAVWSFVDGGRLITALMRSIYMIDRTAFDLEARDVLRLACFYGGLNSMLVTAPSAMALLRRIDTGIAPSSVTSNIEFDTDKIIAANAPLPQRLWINELQWRLRRLEEEGRVEPWLKLIRTEAKVKPLYLTGINWPWVEEVIARDRLKRFRSFDGAYLLLLMELETNSDPQRLNLVLAGLLVGKSFENVVSAILNEFEDNAPAFLRRFLTSANLMTTGLAANYFSALDLRLRAIEEGVQLLGFGPLLTEEMWESEAKLLTNELLLLNVNTGKFEVPWEAFIKDVTERHGALYDAYKNMNLGVAQEALSSVVDTPKIFKNGRREQYRYRRSAALLYQLIIQVVEDFLDHPAFGLEIILSGRFRHNIVLQELQSAVAIVQGLAISPVTENNKRLLIDSYRPVLEQKVYDWCSRRLHTKPDDKSDALFDLIPSNIEMGKLLVLATGISGFEELITIIVDWLKHRLRTQVTAAGKIFVDELKTSLTEAFENTRSEQIASAAGNYRPIDVDKIHKAVSDAVVRRVEEMEVWFEGVDEMTAQQVTLVELGHAAEQLFENLIPGRTLTSQFDLQCHAVNFEPHEVKVAFDLVREIAFNALKHGHEGEVVLIATHQPQSAPFVIEFSNFIGQPSKDNSGRVPGHCYDSPHDALTRDKNSGRYKIAASAATLVGSEVSIHWQSQDGRYSVFVPLRKSKDMC